MDDLTEEQRRLMDERKLYRRQFWEGKEFIDVFDRWYEDVPVGCLSQSDPSVPSWSFVVHTIYQSEFDDANAMNEAFDLERELSGSPRPTTKRRL